MKRKFLSTIVCLTIILLAVLLLPNKASAAEAIASGTCGENLTWTLDDEGTLTISGTGAMADYASASNSPWYSRKDSITEIVISDGVTTIGDRAFYNFTKLVDVTIGEDVTTIGTYAFRGCSTLLEITLPASVTELKGSAFRVCSQLATITLEGNAPTVGSYAFNECATSMTINYYEGSTGYDVSPWSDFTHQPMHTGTWIVDVAATCATEGIRHIDCTYCKRTFTDTIPFAHNYVNGICNICQDTKVIAQGICGGNVQWRLDITGKLTIFGSGSISSYSTGSTPWYAYRDQILSIVVADTITSIPSSAFGGCSNLESITIPFVGGSKKTANNTYQYPLGYIFGTSSYTGGVATEQYYFGSSTSSTTRSTYYIPSSLKLVTVTGGNVLYGAFQNCSNLTNISIPDSVTSIGPYLFKNCSSLQSIIIPNNVTIIPNQAFCGCSSLQAITIPENVISIGDSAFSDCISLQSITIPESVTSLGSYVFDYCISLNYINIPDSITAIPNYAFFGCRNLASIIIPDSVTSIGIQSFYNCSSLQSITIPESVTNISNGAFWGCNNLISITIPDNISSIGEYTFSGCQKLNHVAYTGTQSQWNKITIHSSNTYLSNATRHYETTFIYQSNCEGEGLYCPVCKDYLIRTGNNNSSHNYLDWVITKPATLTSTGQKEQTCATCGDTVTEIIAMLVGNVHHWHIVLEDDYAVNFYLQISESIEKSAQVRLTIGNDTVTYDISDLEKTEDGYFKLTANISAAQMNDIITVMVMNGRDIGCNSTYTAREYCDTILSNPQHSAYHAMVKEMLNYGAMAQIYFDYDTEYLANDGITGVANAEVPETANEMIISDKITDLNFYGASLVFRDRIAVRYYFTGDVTDCTFTANGSTYTPAAKDGIYYVEIPDILPQNIDQQIILVVSHTDDSEISVTYNPMNYIVRMNAKGSENLKNLLKALYNYHLSAKQHVNSEPEYRNIDSGVWKMLSYADGRLYDVTIDFRTSNNSVPSIMVGYGDDITDELQQWLNWGAPLTEWNGRYYYFGSGDGGEITYTISNNIISLSYESILSLTLKRTSGNQFTILSASAERELIANGFTVGNIFTWSAE